MRSRNEFSHPIVPLLLEGLKQCSLLLAVSQTMIDRVQSYKLKMLKRPIVRDHSDEKVSSRVLNTQFSSVSNVDADCIAQAKQNWRRRFPRITSVA